MGTEDGTSTRHCHAKWEEVKVPQLIKTVERAGKQWASAHPRLYPGTKHSHLHFVKEKTGAQRGPPTWPE